MMCDLKGGEENRINRTDSSIIRLILQMVYSQSQIYFILLEIFFWCVLLENNSRNIVFVAL